MDTVRMGRLRQQSNHRTRMSMYRFILLAEWGAIALTALVAWFGYHADPLFLHPQPDAIPALIRSRRIDPDFLTGMAAALAFGLLVPVFLGWASAKALVRIRAAFAPLGFLLPQGPVERLTFAAIALTAGFCEEILYRGFLLHVFRADLHLPALSAAIVAVVAFGVAHTYQGLRGIAASAVLGAIFMAAYLMTRSLWPPILLHAFIDLRPLLLLPRHGTPFEDPAIQY